MECDGRPLLPLANTVLAGLLKKHGLHVSWPTIRLYFSTWSLPAGGLCAVGAAAVWLVSSGTKASFLQSRRDNRSFATPISGTLFLSDPSHTFNLELDAPGQVVAVAFKHSESLQLDPKSLGKLKATGCVLQSVAALTLRRGLIIFSLDQASAGSMP